MKSTHLIAVVTRMRALCVLIFILACVIATQGYTNGTCPRATAQYRAILCQDIKLGLLREANYLIDQYSRSADIEERIYLLIRANYLMDLYWSRG
jgi:hypothetical protein